MFGEERGRIEVVLESEAIDAEGHFKVDAFHDAVVGRANVELREAYLDYRAGPIDMRIGRQVLTWGVGDLMMNYDAYVASLQIIPEVEYKLFDRLSIVLGGNVFGGVNRYTSFGQFRDDSNVYAWGRFTS
jgi:hypothetical protein